MPNLMPDWLPWIRPAGRLLWGIFALGVGMSFFLVLLRRPLLKRPFPNRLGYLAFPVILGAGIIGAKVFTGAQTVIVWATALALIGHGLLMVASRKGSDPEEPATWAECFAGAVGTFALFVVGYAIVPSEWLNYANSYIQWGDNTKFVWRSSQNMLFFPWHWPFNLDYPALRDIVVALIYVAFLGLNLKLWVMWQRRHEVRERAETAGEAPARRSRFGRPLRAKA
ncbi:MAG TPA: hypothetical protein VLV81_09140 [Acidimicrobiia bacterium]|nr:hypothetical protein [Acidimicrobiia bacterium]